MEIITRIDKMKSYVKQVRAKGKRIGFVPTMGYLHQGHLSLIEEARGSADIVIISIFVNPRQFGPGEDYLKYPRDMKQDKQKAEKAGVEVIFAPEVQEMYPEGYFTYVNVERFSEVLCGRNRAGHFKGVATVCVKLFNIVKPDIALFGQKDAQQAIIIKKMVRDLNMDIEIRVLPIVREKDGLAMSSRNKYLNTEQRKDALVLYQALTEAKNMIETGQRNSDTVIRYMRQIINRVDSKIDYISIVDAEQLNTLKAISGKILIDNIVIDTDEHRLKKLNQKSQ
jgi:pantoate--beta-alanine ligase